MLQYLGHSFISTRGSLYWHKCSVCKILAFISEANYWLYDYDHFEKDTVNIKDINCNEYLIKSIIE